MSFHPLPLPNANLMGLGPTTLQPPPYNISVTSGVDTFVGTPNSTLYIQNLNEKVNLKDMQKELYYLFCPFGKVYDIVLKKNIKLRGQAFIIFEKVECASNALVALQGHALFYKPLVVRYSKFKSHAISKMEGCYEEEKAKQDRDKEARSKQTRLTRNQLVQQLLSNQSMHGIPVIQSFPTSAGPDLGLPNKILFVQNLPIDATDETLNAIFSKYQGFKEVRTVPSKKDIAFIEYENDVFANTARLALDRFKMSPTHEIRVSFAKK